MQRTNSTTTRSTAPDNIGTLVQNVREDQKLGPYEKETLIGWAKPDEKARVFTEEAGLIRRFLRLPHFEVEGLRVLSVDGQGQRVSVTDRDQQRYS